jgi:hypothetical protein
MGGYVDWRDSITEDDLKILKIFNSIKMFQRFIREIIGESIKNRRNSK